MSGACSRASTCAATIKSRSTTMESEPRLSTTRHSGRRVRMGAEAERPRHLQIPLPELPAGRQDFWLRFQSRRIHNSRCTRLVLSQGLVRGDTDAEVYEKAKMAYRAYRAERFHTFWHIEDLFRLVRDLILYIFGSATTRQKNQKIDEIEFIGVWDTVAAYGCQSTRWRAASANGSGRSNSRTEVLTREFSVRVMLFRSTMNEPRFIRSSGMKRVWRLAS